MNMKSRTHALYPNVYSIHWTQHKIIVIEMFVLFVNIIINLLDMDFIVNL